MKKFMEKKGSDKMKMRSGKLIQNRGSLYSYIPIHWVREQNLKKGDKIEWHLDEVDHSKLILKKEVKK